MFNLVIFLTLVEIAWCRLPIPIPKGPADDIKISGYCPAPFSPGDPRSDDPINECYYYKCAQGEYTKMRCHDGGGLSQNLIDRYNKYKQGINIYPCTENTNCKIPLDKLGVYDKDTDFCGIDLIIAIDVSCSIETTDKVIVKKFVRGIVNRILTESRQQTKVAGYTFSKDIKHITYLNEFKVPKEVIERFDNYSVDGKPCATATYDALEQARTVYSTEDNGRRPDKKGVYVMITDGQTNPSEKQNDTLAQIDLFKKEFPDMKRCVIGLDNIRQKQLGNKGKNGTIEWSRLADPDCLYSLTSFEQLEGYIFDIARKSCETV